MQIDVVSEGKGGLLGIGSEPAVVRVTLPDADDEPTADDDAELDDEPQPDALSDFLPFADEFDDSTMMTTLTTLRKKRKSTRS